LDRLSASIIIATLAVPLDAGTSVAVEPFSIARYGIAVAALIALTLAAIITGWVATADGVVTIEGAQLGGG
jgi:hypothetical protein